MTTRILEPWEYPKLDGTELERVWRQLPPQAQVVAVLDEAGVVVGCWAVFACVHVEGVWVAPAHRKKGVVARQLLDGMRQTARGLGAQAVFTGAISDEVRGLIAHLGGAKLDGDIYVMPVTGGA